MPRFDTVQRTPRLSDRVTETLMDSILAGRLVDGDRLPTERELSDQFGVSRTVIREAVRSLVGKGLVEVVTPGTGHRIASVGATTVRETMNMFLLGTTLVDYGKLHEVRTVLEISMAGWAAERATAEDRALLEAAHAALVDSLGDPEATSRLDVEFHRAIARVTHNELFVVLLDSIGDVLLQIRTVIVDVPGRARAAIGLHERILDRILAADPEGAREAMRVHLDDADAAWRRVDPLKAALVLTRSGGEPPAG